MTPVEKFDHSVASNYLSILTSGGNGHDYTDFAATGIYAGNNRAARIARQIWRDHARAYAAGAEPYYTNVLRALDARVRIFYKVDPGDVPTLAVAPEVAHS